MTQGRSFAFTQMVQFLRTTRLLQSPAPGLKSGAMAIAIRKGLRSKQWDGCGLTSTDRWAAMNSI
jgi:hypothetical protein